MKLEIIFTSNAEDTFLSIISFIQAKWDNRSAEKFIEKTYKLLDTVAQQPYLFKAYQETDVRKGLITKQTSVVYRVLHDRMKYSFFGIIGRNPL